MNRCENDAESRVLASKCKYYIRYENSALIQK